MIALALDLPAEFLVLQTPKDLVSQISVSAESVRRARKGGGGGSDGKTLLDEMRTLLNTDPDVATAATKPRRS